MKDGKKINVDDMDITHLRNTLKMILRNVEAQKALIAQEVSRKKHHIELNGDMAQQFHETYFADQQQADELFDDDEDFRFMDDYYKNQ
jgi:hexokinase